MMKNQDYELHSESIWRKTPHSLIPGTDLF